MKQKMKRLSLVSLLLLFFSVLPSISFAEDSKLLYDLKYDEQKSVLYGKTKPNANIYINDLAGSIVADDKGEFEMPVPKGLKISTVLMLDAEGDTSTDLRYNFEKNTVETESTQQEGSSSSSSSDKSEEKKESDSKKEEKESDKEKTSDSTKESGTTETSSTESKEASTSQESQNSISSESYDAENEVEEKRSLIWLWTLLIVIGVIGLLVAIYFGYKKKIEKEEAAKKAKRKNSSKKKRQEKLDDDFEEDLYEDLKASEETGTRKKRRSETTKETDLDELIESELNKGTKTKTRKRSSNSSTSDSKKKKKRKSSR